MPRSDGAGPQPDSDTLCHLRRLHLQPLARCGQWAPWDPHEAGPSAPPATSTPSLQPPPPVLPPQLTASEAQVFQWLTQPRVAIPPAPNSTDFLASLPHHLPGILSAYRDLVCDLFFSKTTTKEKKKKPTDLTLTLVYPQDDAICEESSLETANLHAHTSSQPASPAGFCARVVPM